MKLEDLTNKEKLQKRIEALVEKHIKQFSDVEIQREIERALSATFIKHCIAKTIGARHDSWHQTFEPVKGQNDLLQPIQDAIREMVIPVWERSYAGKSIEQILSKSDMTSLHSAIRNSLKHRLYELLEDKVEEIAQSFVESLTMDAIKKGVEKCED